MFVLLVMRARPELPKPHQKCLAARRKIKLAIHIAIENARTAAPTASPQSKAPLTYAEAATAKQAEIRPSSSSVRNPTSRFSPLTCFSRSANRWAQLLGRIDAALQTVSDHGHSLHVTNNKQMLAEPGVQLLLPLAWNPMEFT